MRCRACGASVGSAARFCEQCGARLEAAPRRRAPGSPAESPGQESGDRRIVTALFADLVDYVRLVAEHDPEEVRRLVETALRTMSDAIESFDGTREKFIGDAVFAVFGWPDGHDDDALRAAHCALAIRAGLAGLQDPAGEALQVRIGLATGEVVAAPRGLRGALDWSLTGPAVTTAARIQAIAAAGEILLDGATLRATRKQLEVEDLGRQILRGQTQPIRLARLTAQPGFQPWRTPVGRLVGRHAERQTLRAVLEATVGTGRGATVVVEGEAGIGKSWLLADLEADARSAGFAWTWVDNVSYGTNEPYRFGRALAQAVADEHGTDSGSFTRRLLFTPDVLPDDARRWAGGVAAMARDAAFSGWEAEAELVPSDPGEAVAAIISVAGRYLERLIELSGPRIVVADDLHWIDPSSAGIFEQLATLSARLPLVLVVGARPGLSAPWLAQPHVVRIELAGLDRPDTGLLASSLAGVALAADQTERLHQRTAGNPLFIAETVRALLEDGAGTVDARTLRIEEAGSGRDVPATLRALLGARIDALADDARQALRVASVVGMSFREPRLAELLEVPPEPAIFEGLAAASLIVPLDERDGWRFCHPLIHDVAYAGLLASSRRRLHARVADQLEAAPGASLDAVARHRAAAGDTERAVPLLVAVAEKALASGAAAEAATYWEMAADLLGSDPLADDYRRRARATLGAMPATGS